jgi:hypothetical protein
VRVLENCQALRVAIQPLLVVVQSLGIAGRPVSEHFDVLLELRNRFLSRFLIPLSLLLLLDRHGRFGQGPQICVPPRFRPGPLGLVDADHDDIRRIDG